MLLSHKGKVEHYWPTNPSKRTDVSFYLGFIVENWWDIKRLMDA